MIPLYRDPCFTFRFADDRTIPRFHLEGVPLGTQVSVFKIHPDKGQRLGFLATATVGEGGWVDLAEPIIVKAGDAFIAVPVIIRSEADQDHEAVGRVNRLAFGQDAEARLVSALRAGGFVRVSLVAENAGQVVGHILFSDLSILTETGNMAALALAPMAVLPEVQCMGIGSALVRHGLEACQRQGHRIVVVLGHPDFYPRFGFSANLAQRLVSPYGSGPSHMAVELVRGVLDGVTGELVYSPPFDDRRIDHE